MIWHIVTGEYPPQPGGVSRYTQQVARALAAAGDDAVVWAPPAPSVRDGESDAGVTVRRLPDTFGRRSLRTIDAALDEERQPSRLLVQYVPHAFGWKGANVRFCRWVASRPRHTVWLMFHEVGFPFGAWQSPLRNALAATNRVMARIVAGSANRIFLSIPGWRTMLQPLVTRDTVMTWLPVASGIEISPDAARTGAMRARLGGEYVVGHFGTYNRAIGDRLHRSLVQLAGSVNCSVLLIGANSDRFRDELVNREPSLDSRVHGTGALDADAVSACIAACDLMLQPYPDGISSRRTSAMASLAHGVAVLSTDGWLTEPIWRASDAVALVAAGDPDALAAEAERLLRSPEARLQLARSGRRLYDARFDLRHTIAALRDRVGPSAARVCA